jgi:hypothetical protein
MCASERKRFFCVLGESDPEAVLLLVITLKGVNEVLVLSIIDNFLQRAIGQARFPKFLSRTKQAIQGCCLNAEVAEAQRPCRETEGKLK